MPCTSSRFVIASFLKFNYEMSPAESFSGYAFGLRVLFFPDCVPIQKKIEKVNYCQTAEAGNEREPAGADAVHRSVQKNGAMEAERSEFLRQKQERVVELSNERRRRSHRLTERIRKAQVSTNTSTNSAIITVSCCSECSWEEISSSIWPFIILGRLAASASRCFRTS